MESWFKVAEDLFEVVDRRAKLVVSELSESESQSSASNEGESQARSSKTKNKTQLRQSSTGLAKLDTSEQDQENVEISIFNTSTEKDQALSSDKLVEIRTDLAVERDKEPSYDTIDDKPTPSIISTGILSTDTRYDVASDARKLSATDVGSVSVNGSDTAGVKSEDKPMTSSSSIIMDETELGGTDRPSDINMRGNLLNDGSSWKIGEDKSESEGLEATSPNNDQEKGSESLPMLSNTVVKPNELANDTSPMKVQDQLDEAQRLLKTTVSTGQSKESRLAKVCAGLSSRLQEYKSENAQLEELLVAERELNASYQAHIKQLQKDLSTSRNEVATVESSMAEALASKNAEVEALVSSMDALKKHASATEEQLSSLQVNMDSIMRNRELTETRMIQALREELVSTEHRAEEERIAHNATKMAAVDREVELEHRAVEASNALARIQRTAEESTSRAMELEHKVALLEVECASLNQEVQEIEARARRGQKKSSEEANQILQMQAWHEEAERARQGQRDAESKLSSLEAEIQKMRVDMASMRRDAEHYSRHEHMELEKRYRELTDLLYYKQTQLETMASEKAAAEFQLEKEVRRHQEAQVEAERSRASRRMSSPWEEDADLKALGPLPLHHRHMAGASVQLEKAVKLLDFGAVRATRFLWRYPYARVVLLFYLVFVHLFLMYLLHRLQEQADSLFAKEVAASIGLSNSSLP